MNKDKILIDKLNNRKKLHVHVMDKRQNNNVRIENWKEELKGKKDSSLGKEYQTNLSTNVPEKWESNVDCDYCCGKNNVPSYNLEDYDFIVEQINKIIKLKEKHDKEMSEQIGELVYIVLPLLREKLNKINNEKDIFKIIDFIKTLFSFYKSLN